MNTEKTMPLPAPMLKEKTVKEDGRFLIYYTFPPETREPSTPATTPEQTGGR